MKQIVKTYKIYTYNELNEEAKQKVKEWYLSGQESFIFDNMIEDDLGYLFPHSSLQFQYSLAYCQGDGFNIYGNVDIRDVINYKQDGENDYFTEKEKRTLLFYVNECDCEILLPENRSGYSYCVCDRNDILDDFTYTLENCDIRNIKHDVIKKLQKAIETIFCNLCGRYEKDGYDFFYEIDEKTLEEYCNDNDWYFLESGELFAYCENNIQDH